MAYHYSMKTTLVIADDKYEKIRKVAQLRKKSIAHIINEAIDETLFAGQNEGLKSLKGVLKGSKITLRDLNQVKPKIPDCL